MVFAVDSMQKVYTDDAEEQKESGNEKERSPCVPADEKSNAVDDGSSVTLYRSRSFSCYPVFCIPPNPFRILLKGFAVHHNPSSLKLYTLHTRNHE